MQKRIAFLDEQQSEITEYSETLAGCFCRSSLAEEFLTKICYNKCELQIGICIATETRNSRRKRYA